MPYIPYEDEPDWSKVARHDELMHQLEAEEAEKDRIIDEAFLAYEAEDYDDEAEVPASC